MSKPPRGLSNPSMASTSQEGERSPLLVTLLSREWRSSTNRDLSTLIRELAIQLAKHPSVQVSVFLSQCSEDDKYVAAIDKVKLIKAEKMTGFDPVDWLINIPEDHVMNCIIGHGVRFGRQIPCIRRTHQCRWIQIVYTAPEELAMHNSNTDAIPKGEMMQQTEIELCELADQVVAVGPKLADTYRRFLCSSKKHQPEKIIDLTPSIFTEFKDVKHATEERRTFRVLVIGSGGSEDFYLNGYGLAAEAISQLKETSYQLKFVCAPREKENEIVKKVLEYGIGRSQLIVRSFNENRETLAKLFCEVDLAIMPSSSEGFGLTALEALSAGLPVLVSSNSGLGQALMKVPLGTNCVVDSEDPNDWASKIKAVREKNRDVRLAESKLLREKYLEKYSWREPCGALVEKMRNLVTALNLEMDVERMKPAEQNTHGRTPVSAIVPGGSRDDEYLEASAPSVSSGHTQPDSAVSQTSTEEVMRAIASRYLKVAPPSSMDELNDFMAYMKGMRVIITGVHTGSLLITVRCDSLQILEGLWKDYLSGHLGEVVQKCFVTEELLADLSLAELKLKTTISEEEYKACKKYFERDPARDDEDEEGKGYLDIVPDTNPEDVTSEVNKSTLSRSVEIVPTPINDWRRILPQEIERKFMEQSDDIWKALHYPPSEFEIDPRNIPRKSPPFNRPPPPSPKPGPGRQMGFSYMGRNRMSAGPPSLRPMRQPSPGFSPIFKRKPNLPPDVPSRHGKPLPLPKPQPRPAPPIKRATAPTLTFPSSILNFEDDEDEEGEGFLDIVPDTNPEDVTSEVNKSTLSRSVEIEPTDINDRTEMSREDELKLEIDYFRGIVGPPPYILP